MADHAPNPDEVRQLRGEMTRAEFARRVGVTPLSIYRWELPTDHAESRRPRRHLWARIRGEVSPANSPAGTAGLPTADPSTGMGPSPAVMRATTVAEILPAEEEAVLLPLLHALFNARWDEADRTLLDLTASHTIRTESGKALMQVAAGMFRLLGRNDVNGAATALMPVLADADSGRLPDIISVRAYAVAALLFATANGRLFNPGRVNTFAARIEALSAGPDNLHLRQIAWVARMQAAWHVADSPLVASVIARDTTEPAGATEAMAVWCLMGEARALAALAECRHEDAAQRFRATADLAEEHGFALIACRCLAHLAMIELERHVRPDPVLDLALRCKRLAADGRLEPGAHEVVLACAEGSALYRLARYEDAVGTLEQGELAARRTDWPPVDLVFAWQPLYAVGAMGDMRDRLEWLKGRTEGPLHTWVGAGESLLEAFIHFNEGEPSRALAAYERAAALTRDLTGHGWLENVAQTLVYAMRLFAGEMDRARSVLRQVKRNLERYPSPIRTANVRLFEILHCAMEGRTTEAAQLAEAGIAMTESAGNRGLELRFRHFLAVAEYLAEKDGAAERLEEMAARMREAGARVPIPMSMEQLADKARSQRVLDSPWDARPVTSLIVPIERLADAADSARGVNAELVAVVDGLFEGGEARLDELDADGAVRRIAGSGKTDADTTVEFSDGCGRRYRLGVVGPCGDDQRAVLQVLARVAGLMLEVGVLRNTSFTGGAAGTPDSRIEVPGVVASSPPMRALLDQVARLGQSRSSVMVHGESGSGKEVVARAIHELSTRKDRPYITFNCAAVPHELFEGQLFGHRKGAFTGATSDHPGVIRAADTGTLFLDEIGDLPLALQPKLLRFLENGEVFPLGETQPTTVDVRVIAATHQEIDRMVRDGRFREDLFYRLQVVPLTIPPLRDRRDDVLALARHFIDRLAPAGEGPLLGPDAVAALLAHDWPGNVRELRNVIERSLAFSPLPKVLTAEHLRIEP